jgi:hypothetical protein
MATTSTFSAIVLDGKGNPIPQANIAVYDSKGTLHAESMTDETGQVSHDLDMEFCDYQIHAASGESVNKNTILNREGNWQDIKIVLS